eukprot:Selendium_serpulae@DN6492_c2_g2_i1.p1
MAAPQSLRRHHMFSARLALLLAVGLIGVPVARAGLAADQLTPSGSPGAELKSYAERETLVVAPTIAHIDAHSVVPLLTTEWTAMSDGAHRAGDATLVAGMQAENNARAVVMGGADLCSNKVFNEGTNSNFHFCRNTASWGLQRRGVLVWKNLKHHKVGETHAPHMYRIRDKVRFTVELWELRDTQFHPYLADDVQLDFTMLNPYIRKFLKLPKNTKTGNNATYGTTITCPDKYGIFKFVLNYRRRGYSTLLLESLSPVRNYKHNDYERFIWCATPYYTSVGTIWLGLLGFCFFYLYSDAPKRDGDKAKDH